MPILTTLNDSVSAGLSWKEQFKSAIRDPFQLAKRLGIAQPTPSQVAACESFGLFAPEPFLSRIDASDPNDPLLRQILPLAEENESPAGFTTDPLAEDQATRTEGLLQKIPRPGSADHEFGLRNQLPLLLSSPLPLRTNTPFSDAMGNGDRRNRQRSNDRRSDL